LRRAAGAAGAAAGAHAPAAGVFLLAAQLLGGRLVAQNPAPTDSARPAAPAPLVPLRRPAADTTRPFTVDTLVARARVRGDSVRPRAPLTPGGAFLRSLLLPGWGQAELHRNVTGGFFIAFEGLALAMVWKTGWQLDYANARGKFVKSHTQEQQDWLVLLFFNHLMAATEAFVSSHLFDFPEGLKLQALPDGRTGLGVQVRF
jgi:hypothetical protein